MIISNYKFATFIVDVKDFHRLWDNLHKILLSNKPINNPQDLSIIMGIMLGIKENNLNKIQALYASVIYAIILGFVCVI